MATTAQWLLAQHPQTIATDLDGEVMVMSLVSGHTFKLDRRASKIWNLLTEPRRVDDLVGELLLEYSATAEQCRADVTEFADELLRLQIATRHEQ